MAPRAIPTITNASDMQAFLKNYQQTLNQSITTSPTPIAPYNFSAKNQRGGILLTWTPIVYPGHATSLPPSNTSKLSKADGYEIQRSSTGNFGPGGYITIALRDPTQSSYLDSVGGAPQTFYYRIRATNGTPSNPYSIHGVFSGVVKQTSIDSSDTVTVPAVVNDTFTNSLTQARARNWPRGVNSPFQ
jgi:hypothetical protein